MRVVSRLSVGVNGGRIVGNRPASMVLPVPGLPIMSTLWAKDLARDLPLVITLGTMRPNPTRPGLPAGAEEIGGLSGALSKDGLDALKTLRSMCRMARRSAASLW